MLSQSLLNPRRHVGVHAEHVSKVSSTDYPGHYPDEDHSWDLVKFKEVCDLFGVLCSVCFIAKVEFASKGATAIE